MNQRTVLPSLVLVALLGGCADTGTTTATRYGETARTTTAMQSERDGTIARIENLTVDDEYKLGIGTAVGAVAGGLLGAGVSDSTAGAAAGAVLGGAAGTYAQSRMDKKEVQQLTVNMVTGGSVTITQPTDARLREGLPVRVEGSGETARVVPR